MRYYKGDIVEIITSKYKSYKDVPKHEIGYFKNQDEPVPYIGQRFRVFSACSESLCADIDNRLCLYIHPDKVLLYKRPFLNWVKHIFKMK